MNTQTYSMFKSMAWLELEEHALNGYHSAKNLAEHQRIQELLREHQDDRPADFIFALSENAVGSDLAFDLLRALLRVLFPGTDFDITAAANPGRIFPDEISAAVGGMSEESILDALLEDAAARERAHHRANQRANALEM